MLSDATVALNIRVRHHEERKTVNSLSTKSIIQEERTMTLKFV
jgi:hypothetical protein